MSDPTDAQIETEEGKLFDGQIADLEEARKIQSDTCVKCGAELYVLEIGSGDPNCETLKGWLMQCSNCKTVISREGLLIPYREVEA